MKREIKIFMKRNKILLVIAFLCVILTVKQMDAPFILEYNWFTELLFKKVETDSKWYELMELANNLGFAYYSSLIFYFLVDYFPARRKERIAFSRIRDHLSEIVMHIDCLFTNLVFILDKGNKMSDVKNDIDIISQMASLRLSLEPILCNWKIIDKETEDLLIGGECETFIPFEEVQKECRLILNEIKVIDEHIGASDLEEEIIKYLSVLSENRYLNNMNRLNAQCLKNGDRAMVCACQTSDIVELMHVHHILCKLPIRQYICIREEATETDRKNLEKTIAKMKKEHPESWALLEQMMNHMN